METTQATIEVTPFAFFFFCFLTQKRRKERHFFFAGFFLCTYAWDFSSGSSFDCSRNQFFGTCLKLPNRGVVLRKKVARTSIVAPVEHNGWCKNFFNPLLSSALFFFLFGFVGVSDHGSTRIGSPHAKLTPRTGQNEEKKKKIGPLGLLCESRNRHLFYHYRTGFLHGEG